MMMMMIRWTGENETNNKNRRMDANLLPAIVHISRLIYLLPAFFFRSDARFFYHNFLHRSKQWTHKTAISLFYSYVSSMCVCLFAFFSSSYCSLLCTLRESSLFSHAVNIALPYRKKKSFSFTTKIFSMRFCLRSQTIGVWFQVNKSYRVRKIANNNTCNWHRLI